MSKHQTTPGWQGCTWSPDCTRAARRRTFRGARDHGPDWSITTHVCDEHMPNVAQSCGGPVGSVEG